MQRAGHGELYHPPRSASLPRQRCRQRLVGLRLGYVRPSPPSSPSLAKPPRSWAINQSYAQDPVMRPTIYNHSAPAGSRFQTDLPESTIQRMYHSSATLLPDGSVFIAGSNPNADVIDDASNATCSFAFLTPRGALADHSLTTRCPNRRLQN